MDLLGVQETIVKYVKGLCEQRVALYVGVCIYIYIYRGRVGTDLVDGFVVANFAGSPS